MSDSVLFAVLMFGFGAWVLTYITELIYNRCKRQPKEKREKTLSILKMVDGFFMFCEKYLSITILVFLLWAAYLSATRPFDPTDDLETDTRSGLYYYVDYGTGCQYIKASWFATLTPRLDKEGRHICG